MTNVHGSPDRRWWRVPRTRGLVTGGLLVLLGVWGGLAIFIGPYLGYGFTPNTPWTFTWGRFWLEILPAAATVLGGLALLGTANRFTGSWGGWLAAAGGAWFVVGGTFSQFWNGGANQAGVPTGSTLSQVAQTIGLFLGLGVVVLFLAAVALTRFGIEPKRAAPEAERVDAYPEEPAPAEPAADETTGPVADEPAAEEPTGRRRTRLRRARHERESRQ
ncbi:MAG: hypothetical protein ACRDMV_00940 [Streptosporangiales bacterium]